MAQGTQQATASAPARCRQRRQRSLLLLRLPQQQRLRQAAPAACHRGQPLRRGRRRSAPAGSAARPRSAPRRCVAAAAAAAPRETSARWRCRRPPRCRGAGRQDASHMWASGGARAACICSMRQDGQQRAEAGSHAGMHAGRIAPVCPPQPSASSPHAALGLRQDLGAGPGQARAQRAVHQHLDVAAGAVVGCNASGRACRAGLVGNWWARSGP